MRAYVRRRREGVCSFGSQFGYQDHPNVEMVAVTDLDPKKCKLLQERTRAPKTYPSCEELIKNAAADKIEALYIATDAPSHARLAIMALKGGETLKIPQQLILA